MRAAWVQVLVLASLVGCGGASRSDAIALPDGDARFDAPCPEGGSLTPRSLLANVKSVYSSTYAPERGSPRATPLTIDVAYTNGKIVCTPATTIGTKDPLNVPASLSVELAFTFKTLDGTFDESFVAAVTGPADPNAYAASLLDWTVTIPGTAVRGSYAFSLGTAAEAHLLLSGRFNWPNPGTTNGEISEQSAGVSGGGGSW